jgi:hypothetical protein
VLEFLVHPVGCKKCCERLLYGFRNGTGREAFCSKKLQGAEENSYKDHPQNRHTTKYNTTHSLQKLGSSSAETIPDRGRAEVEEEDATPVEKVLHHHRA